MNDRYTTPATSRALAEAGLEQPSIAYHWCGETFHARHHICTDAVRAIDLTDILRELTRPRPEEADARPLIERFVDDWSLSDGPGGSYRFSVRHRYPDRYISEEGTEMLRADGQEDSPVEAAAACLLTLLRERRKP